MMTTITDGSAATAALLTRRRTSLVLQARGTEPVMDEYNDFSLLSSCMITGFPTLREVMTEMTLMVESQIMNGL
jgi:hypothetical protein